MFKKSIIKINLIILLIFALFAISDASAYDKITSIKIVNQAFSHILERNPNRCELIHYSNLLTYQNWTAKKLVITLVCSSEHIRRFYHCPKSYVIILYRHLLGRNPATSCLNHWTNHLKSLKRKYGLSKACEKVAKDMINSLEYRQKFGDHIVPHY